MERGFCRRINGGQSQGNKAEYGGVVEDGAAPALDVVDESRGQTNRPQEVRVDGGGEELIVDGAGGLVRKHDAGVVDQYVQLRVFGDEPGCDGLNALWISDVELDRFDPRVGGNDCIEMSFTPPRNNDFVSALMERFGEGAADAGAAAGDEDGIYQRDS